jgi:hypothetical protein
MKSFGILLTTILLSLGVAAQTGAPPLSYSPDQKIVLSATFEGVGADQVSSGNFCFGLQGTVSPSQPSFNNQMCSNGNDSRLIPPHTVEMTFTIPKNQATGEYRLNQMSADVRSLNISFNYGKDEVPNRMVTIKNTATATKPKLKDVQVR